ncbi:MAG: hypothetical protein OXH13_04480 [Chloroflexi bacterium]|nr:hypothetical protein [Chloroflexota bacterium]MCY3696068.1 hypothetical protein [Chloroflexota bacterium]
MTAGSSLGAERLARRLGMAVLLVLLVLVMWLFGTYMLLGIDQSLHHTVWPAQRTGVELVAIPLVAIVAARIHLLSNWLNDLRWSRAGPYLTLLMAASLVGLIGYLVWSWQTAWTTAGPDEFGFPRWLGAALAAAFTIVWLPLFPRITATLAGMIAGPAVVAVIGYVFFASAMPVSTDRWGSDGDGLIPVLAALLMILLWAIGAYWLRNPGRQPEAAGNEPRPVAHALWSGGVMLFITLLGLG